MPSLNINVLVRLLVADDPVQYRQALSNAEEFLLGSLAMSTDSDDDGMADGWEAINSNIVAPDRDEDYDNDGISNYDEYLAFLNGGPNTGTSDTAHQVPHWYNQLFF